MSTHKVFVYGTLREAKPATHILPGYIMFAVNGVGFNFPFIQPVGDEWTYQDVQVVGNIIEVDDKGLKKLDKYEGVDRGLYERKKVFVSPNDDAEAEEVWVYIGGAQLVLPLIESGDWLSTNR